ncbi:hypothetical protein ACQW5G_07275 [Fructilactobacillus sp. Tb1]|uniref:hypothetical protein n=1 Tax=Fructilactobacillus sp. Tb1 TaxID=3422304 RepID=UPI003D2AEE56
MNITEFNYYNNLKNRLAKVQDEINLEKKNYLKKMTNINQLKNDYDVDTIDQLVSVLNNGDEDQTSENLRNALQNHDKQYLLDNMQKIDGAEFENLNYMYDEAKDVEKTLATATHFYNETALPVLNKMENSHLVRIDDLKSSGSDSDTVLEINYFSTYDDFKEDFAGANYVEEIIKEHLENHQTLSVMITADNYPNQYDITIMPAEGE